MAQFFPEEIPTLKSVQRYGLFLQKKEVLVSKKQKKNKRKNTPVKICQAWVLICILSWVIKHP